MKRHIVKKAFHNAKEIGLDGLVVIGGDGSYRGAGYLSELGLPLYWGSGNNRQ